MQSCLPLSIGDTTPKVCLPSTVLTFYPAMVADLMALKTVNADLKILLAVGGWTHSAAEFTNMVATSASRSAFVQDAITFLR